MVNDVVYRKDVLDIVKLGKTVTQLERDVMVLPAVAVCHIAELIDAQRRIKELEEEVEELFQENMAHIELWGKALAERDMWRAKVQGDR